jgi:hypothetical protein
MLLSDNRRVTQPSLLRDAALVELVSVVSAHIAPAVTAAELLLIPMPLDRHCAYG